MDLIRHKKRLEEEFETLSRVSKLTSKPEDIDAANLVAIKIQGLTLLMSLGFKTSTAVLALMPAPPKEEPKPEKKTPEKKPKAVKKPAKKRIKKVEK